MTLACVRVVRAPCDPGYVCVRVASGRARRSRATRALPSVGPLVIKKGNGMDLEDIRAAISDLSRQKNRLMKQIAHREEQAALRAAEIDKMKADLDAVIDRWMNLIKEEQKIVRPGSVEE